MIRDSVLLFWVTLYIYIHVVAFCRISIYQSLFVQKAERHNVAITYSRQDSETTEVLSTVLNT